MNAIRKLLRALGRSPRSERATSTTSRSVSGPGELRVTLRTVCGTIFVADGLFSSRRRLLRATDAAVELSLHTELTADGMEIIAIEIDGLEEATGFSLAVDTGVLLVIDSEIWDSHVGEAFQSDISEMVGSRDTGPRWTCLTDEIGVRAVACVPGQGDGIYFFHALSPNALMADFG